MAQLKAPPLDKQGPGLHQAAGNAPAGCDVKGLHRSAGHPHDPGTFFLGHTLVIHQPEALIFLQSNGNRRIGFCSFGDEARNSGQSMDALYFCGPAHKSLLFDICHNIIIAFFCHMSK